MTNIILDRVISVTLITTFFCSIISGQFIMGKLSKLTDIEIILKGFDGLDNYHISCAQINSTGHFKLKFSEKDYGLGYLIAADEKPFFLILNGENIEIIGESLSNPQTISTTQGQENRWLQQYAKEHPRREQALNAWTYLEKLYTSDSLFSVHHKVKPSIQNEINRLHDEDAAFLERLPEDSYVRWYLPVRKLISSVPVIAQFRSEEIPPTLEAFRKLDYADPRLYKSGLLKDAIDGHFWMIENSGRSLDSVTIAMQRSIDAMMEYLVKDEEKLNEVTGYLFKLLERRSLVEVSEYLALKILNEVSCTIESDLAKQLESYRAIKIGNIAPDFV